MKLTVKHAVATAATIAAMLTSQAAMADIFTYEFAWTGTDRYGSINGESGASASAIISVEQDALAQSDMGEILSFSMTVKDAADGNGTFNRDDFYGFHVSYRLYPDLVPNERYQLTSWDIYGTGFFGNGGGAPISFQADRMWAGGVQGGTALYFASAYITRTLAATVPEPDTYALLAAGLGLIGFAGRRRARLKGSR